MHPIKGWECVSGIGSDDVITCMSDVFTYESYEVVKDDVIRTRMAVDSSCCPYTYTKLFLTM